MTDKELLELAAKAAGYSTSKYWHNDGVHCGRKYEYTDGPHGWNPLTDDADAFRLAVRLGFPLEFDPVHECDADECDADEYRQDPYAATRRAITRAAAETGKGMMTHDEFIAFCISG